MADTSGIAAIGGVHLSPGEKRQAIPGMASWAGEGPQGTTCRTCKHWDFDKARGWFRDNVLWGNGLKPCRCDLACRMMNRFDLPKLNNSRPSCKFYEAAIDERPFERPKRERANPEKSNGAQEPGSAFK